MTELIFKVQGYDTDPNGVMKLSSLQRYLQQAAAVDSDKCGATYANMKNDGIAFVIIKMQYEISDMPRFDTEFTVKTWSDRIEGISFTRIYEVYIGKKLAVTATGIWVLINIKDRRVVRPSALKYDLGECRLKERAVFPRHIAIQTPYVCAKHAVKYSELDINGHMNNCVYADVLYDNLPLERDLLPKRVTMLYISECGENDELEIVYEKESNIVRAHINSPRAGKTNLEAEFVY